jgi:Tol biopolymer transport system component
VKNSYWIVIALALVALLGTLRLNYVPGRAPTAMSAEERDQALRAKRIARQFAAGAEVLTVFDRQGNVVTTVGEPALYDDVAFSPDGAKLAVTKADIEGPIRTTDIWVLDIASGSSTLIASNPAERNATGTPVWSPDGSQVAYLARRDGYTGLYRKASDGTGAEELLYRSPGSGLGLRHWSLDGRFIIFSSTDLSGGILYALPLAGQGEREPVVVLRSESQLRGASLSPDNRFLSYISDPSGKMEFYVRPFDPSAPGTTPPGGPWQVSDQGAQWAFYSGWRRDGKELYYLAADQGVMAVQVSTSPRFRSEKPKLLFRLSQAVLAGPGHANVSRDGQRIAVAAPAAPALQQITVFDRQGNVVTKIAEPGPYTQPSLSPDGTKVAVMTRDPRENDLDIWTFDLATGKGLPLTVDTFSENGPVWSSDGGQVAYSSPRGSYPGIYRKAWDGSGNEEQLFRYTPGAGLWLTDWSADGRFLTFHDNGTGGILNVVPLDRNQQALEREAIEWLRDEYEAAQGRFSPDSRFIAYLSNEGKSTEEINSNLYEVYVRPFDPAKSDVSAGDERPVQVSTAGALGMISWRQDGKEMYYLTPDWEVVAVDVTTTPIFQAGAPRLLFKLPANDVSEPSFSLGRLPGLPLQWKNVSADGQRFVFTINVPASITAR